MSGIFSEDIVTDSFISALGEVANYKPNIITEQIHIAGYGMVSHETAKKQAEASHAEAKKYADEGNHDGAAYHHMRAAMFHKAIAEYEATKAHYSKPAIKEGIENTRRPTNNNPPPYGTIAWNRAYGKYTAAGQLRKKPNPNKPPSTGQGSVPVKENVDPADDRMKDKFKRALRRDKNKQDKPRDKE